MKAALAVPLVLVLAACAHVGEVSTPVASEWPTLDASAISSSDLNGAGITGLSIASGTPDPKVPAATAQSAAELRVFGGSDRGPLITFGRAMVKANGDPSTPEQSAWVFVYGPGGTFQPQAPSVSPGIIQVQIVLVDDQTGSVISHYVTFK